MKKSIQNIWRSVSLLGITNKMPYYAFHKRVIFNCINFIGVLLSAIGFLYAALAQVNNKPLALVLNCAFTAVGLLLLFLMQRHKFKLAISIAFIIYPLLISLLAVVTGQAIVQFYQLIVCGLGCFLINKKENIAAICLYALCWVTGISFYMHAWWDNYTEAIAALFIIVTASLITYTILCTIKYQVWQYENELKNNAGLLLKQKNEIELQKEILQQQTIVLEEKNISLTALNDVKTKMFSIIAHDLRGHFHGIRQVLQMAAESDTNFEYLKECLPDLNRDAVNTCKLLDDLLSWGGTLLKSVIPHKTIIGVNGMLTEMANFHTATAEKKQISFSLHAHENIFIYADIKMTETVCRNIISNAIKFSNPGSAITIAAEKKYNTVIISITDTGRGMTEEQSNNIFTGALLSKVGTAGEIGTGLGLLLSHELVKKNDGRLEIKSSPGKGTKVAIELPAYNMPESILTLKYEAFQNKD